MNNLIKNKWICVKTNFRQEFIAKEILKSKGFDLIMPYYIKSISHSRYKTKVKYPVFPTYGFLNFSGDISALYQIKYARGVDYYLQKEDGCPRYIPYEVINNILSLKQKDGSYKLDTYRFNKGDEVNVTEGVFSGIKAIFKERVDEWRSSLLINFLGRISEVSLNSQMIEKTI